MVAFNEIRFFPAYHLLPFSSKIPSLDIRLQVVTFCEAFLVCGTMNMHRQMSGDWECSKHGHGFLQLTFMQPTKQKAMGAGLMSYLVSITFCVY